MGILEKLRPLPRWKHADPAVRAAAVFELGPEEGDALLAIAREDAEGRVRRAAVARIDDLSVLAEVAKTDPDEDVRLEAIRGLAGAAAEAEEVSRATAAVQQLLTLGRTKEVVAITRNSTSPLVRAAIVDLLDDPKSIGSVSRHAQDSATRLQALSRLSDADEILNVALKSEHTDVAVAALERVTDRDALVAISQRARNKVASRRARARLRLLDDAAQANGDESGAAMSTDDRRRATDLLNRAEALVAVADPEEAATALAAVRLAWAEMQADVDLAPALTQQFEAASEAVREAINERTSELVAEAERMRALAREQSDRVGICEAIENLSEPDAADRIAELKVRWDNLPPMPSEYAASLTRRFQDASRAFEERERRRLLAHAAAGRLETLATELEQLIASDQPLEEIIARWRGLRRDTDVLRDHASTNPQAGERLEAAIAVLEEREQQHQQSRTKLEQDNLKRLQQICRHVDSVAAGEALTLKAGDRALREIRSALEERAPLPSKKDRQEVQSRLEHSRTILAPRVQELREADEWQRWANLQVQEELCREMEALATEENLDVANRRMRELQSRWKQVAIAPRAQGEAMWRRFKVAHDAVFARTAAHFAAQHEERVANFGKKQALCEQAEALADSTDWVKTAATIQQLQGDWKTIGPASRGHEKAIWERFRAACDRFFTRRQEDLKRRKEEWSANLAKKEALCLKAEAFADGTDWDATAAQLRQLQTEWKTIGPVRKSKSEAIWQRFRAACDRFFERYKHRDQVELQAKASAREVVIRELESLLPGDGVEPGEPPGDLYATVQSARARWQQAPELPRQIQQDFAAQYYQALGRLVGVWPGAFAGTELDPVATQKRMEKLLEKVEALATPAAPPQGRLSPAELLAQQWRERLAANTMGAASGSSADTGESRWHAAEQEVRSAQSQWTRLGPVSPEIAGPLNERFQRACRKFYDHKRKAS